MERPASQHCYALAAEVERVVLTIIGLHEELTGESHEFSSYLGEAETALRQAVPLLLEAGKATNAKRG